MPTCWGMLFCGSFFAMYSIISVLSGLRGSPQGTYVPASSLVGHRIVTTAYYRKEPFCFAILYMCSLSMKSGSCSKWWINSVQRYASWSKRLLATLPVKSGDQRTGKWPCWQPWGRADADSTNKPQWQFGLPAHHQQYSLSQSLRKCIPSNGLPTCSNCKPSLWGVKRGDSSSNLILVPCLGIHQLWMDAIFSSPTWANLPLNAGLDGAHSTQASLAVINSTFLIRAVLARCQMVFDQSDLMSWQQPAASETSDLLEAPKRDAYK